MTLDRGLAEGGAGDRIDIVDHCVSRTPARDHARDQVVCQISLHCGQFDREFQLFLGQVNIALRKSSRRASLALKEALAHVFTVDRGAIVLLAELIEIVWTVFRIGQLALSMDHQAACSGGARGKRSAMRIVQHMVVLDGQQMNLLTHLIAIAQRIRLKRIRSHPISSM